MKNNIALQLPVYTNTHDAFPIPIGDKYDYWLPLAEGFLSKANAIEVHCWNEEKEISEELVTLHKEAFQVEKEENLTIFKGSKTTAITEYLLNDFASENGRFKWFTVNFLMDEETLFHSGHWATELFMPNLSDEEIEFIKSVIPEGTNLHIY
ncbi:hypothetical protein [Bacillus sp. B-jedd]|uniref:hypothetical protein n=1 Tax=Bacillus sp. B-jedd TaxID=1476857 RepID=UPI00051557E5|nr:hypothetical protein [Bacillus sp. B-jedd]CEG27162.1 hypothetical protein BN1002_02018 [Bacillus sp. B-jedd]